MENSHFTPLQTKSNRKIQALIALLGILLVGAIGYGAFVWNQLGEQKNKVAELESQNQALKNTKDDNQDNAQAPAISEDDQVVAAFNTHCNAIAVPEGFERNTVIGTMTAAQKKIVYSADKKFAALNGKCDFKKAGVEDEGGGAAAYIFKKVDNTWVVIVTTQQRPAPTDIERYAIPEDFLAATGMDQ